MSISQSHISAVLTAVLFATTSWIALTEAQEVDPKIVHEQNGPTPLSEDGGKLDSEVPLTPSFSFRPPREADARPLEAETQKQPAAAPSSELPLTNPQAQVSDEVDAVTTSKERQAEVTSPSGTPSPTLNLGKPFTPEDVRSMRTLLAEGLFLTKKTDEARADLIALYELEIGPRCMPDITAELKYYGSKGNMPCNEFLDKVFAIDSDNPLAICARDGIDTRSCRAAYAKLEIDSYPSDFADADLGSDPRLQREINKMRQSQQKILVRNQQELERSIGKLRAEPTKPRLAEVKNLMARTLLAACVNPRLKLAPVSEETFLAESDEFEALSSPQTSPSQKPYRHVRLLPDQCMRMIELALSTFSGYPPAICQKWGYYSPTCIDAKRVEARRKAKEAASSGQPPPTPAQLFKTF